MNPFAEYRITSPFGWRTSPITGVREWHTGVDLVKAHQSPIYAFVGGEVIHAREGVTGSGFGGYGVVVAIRDPHTDHLHCYAHLDMALVKVGQRVERGQMIGRQGNTGQSTGSHLHYEIRKSSSPQFGWIADRQNNCFDPTQYLADLYNSEIAALIEKEVAGELDDIEKLEKRIKALENRASMPVPDWAHDAVTSAVKAKLIDTPNGGSFDFYRILTVLHRNGLIK